MNDTIHRSFNQNKIIKLYLFIIFIIHITAIPDAYADCHTADNWQEVRIIYFTDFSMQENKIQNNTPENNTPENNTPGCFTAFRSSSPSGPPVIPVLRCKEQVNLLRTAAVIQHWKKLQDRSGFIKLSLPEFGINHVKAKIIAITTLPANKTKSNIIRRENNNIVTGTFIRHAINVEKYQFQEEETGRNISINVTDNHRFYVKNRHKFIPIKKISSKDKMITATGNTIRLLCAGNKLHDCGQPYAGGRPSLVYNLEIVQRHTYFAGEAAILVHNNYRMQVTRYHKEDSSAMRYKGMINKITGKRDGKGISYYRNGYKEYMGDWKNGQRHGHGIHYSSRVRGRILYRGDFENGKYSGVGTLFHEDSGVPIYIGQFKDGQFSGQGTLLYSKNKPYYTGEFLAHKPHGLGTMFIGDNIKFYAGEFFNGEIDGFGTLFQDKGTKIEFRGMWRRNQREGFGTQHNKMGFPVARGWWHNNMLVR